jgi:hypothetical protein
VEGGGVVGWWGGGVVAWVGGWVGGWLIGYLICTGSPRRVEHLV